MTDKKEVYYEVNSDKLVKWLVNNKYIARLGTGSRYNDEDAGMHEDKLKVDNTYNWELTAEGDDGEQEFYNLSHNFEIRETSDLLMLSKHVGVDIRGGYEDEVIYLKLHDDVLFYEMVVDGMHENKTKVDY